MPALCSKSLSMYVWNSASNTYAFALHAPGGSVVINSGVAVPIGMYKVTMIKAGSIGDLWSFSTCNLYMGSAGGGLGDCPGFPTTRINGIGAILGYTMSGATSTGLQDAAVDNTVAQGTLLQFTLNAPTILTASWDANPIPPPCSSCTLPSSHPGGGTLNYVLTRFAQPC